MSKTIIKDLRRIEFFTRKSKELEAIHPSKMDARWRRRCIRLMNYKAAMHKWIK